MHAVSYSPMDSPMLSPSPTYKKRHAIFDPPRLVIENHRAHIIKDEQHQWVNTKQAIKAVAVDVRLTAPNTKRSHDLSKILLTTQQSMSTQRDDLATSYRFAPVKQAPTISVDITALKAMTKARKPLPTFVPSEFRGTSHRRVAGKLVEDARHKPAEVRQRGALSRNMTMSLSRHDPGSASRQAMPIGFMPADDGLDGLVPIGVDSDEPPGWWLALYGYSREIHSRMRAEKVAQDTDQPQESRTHKMLRTMTHRKPKGDLSSVASSVFSDTDSNCTDKATMSNKKSNKESEMSSMESRPTSLRALDTLWESSSS